MPQEALMLREQLDKAESLIGQIVAAHSKYYFASDFGQAVTRLLIESDHLCECNRTWAYKQSCERCQKPASIQTQASAVGDERTSENEQIA